MGLRSSISDTMLSEQSHFFLHMTLPDGLARQTFVPERNKKKKILERWSHTQEEKEGGLGVTYKWLGLQHEADTLLLNDCIQWPSRESATPVFPGSWRISYGWNINNNYSCVPWAVLSPCTYFLCSKHMTVSCWHIGMTYCQWCHALEVESRCNIESYCIFMGRGGRVFFF